MSEDHEPLERSRRSTSKVEREVAKRLRDVRWDDSGSLRAQYAAEIVALVRRMSS